MFTDIVLKVEKCYHTMDMSVSNSGSYTKLYFWDQLIVGTHINQGEFSDVVVVGRTNDSITLQWNGNEYHVPMDTEVSTEWVMRNNPYLSVDEAMVKFYLSEQDLFAEAVNSALNVTEIHEKHGAWNTSLFHNKKEMALRYLKRVIDMGGVSNYPLYALYCSSDNWHTHEIVRFDEFHSIMQEGIKLGCLNADCEFGWSIFKLIVDNNDTKTWAGKCMLYTQLVKTAADAGVEEAIDIWTEYAEGDKLYEWIPEKKDYVFHIESREVIFNNGVFSDYFESYYYTLDDLTPGMVIYENEKYSPVKVLSASKLIVTLECDGDKYNVALDENITRTPLRYVDSSLNEYFFSFKYFLREKDDTTVYTNSKYYNDYSNDDDDYDPDEDLNFDDDI